MSLLYSLADKVLSVLEVWKPEIIFGKHHTCMISKNLC